MDRPKMPKSGRTGHSVERWAPITMEKAFSPPTSSDYKETARLFRDFGLALATPPEFKTKNSLYHWRTRKILTALA